MHRILVGGLLLVLVAVLASAPAARSGPAAPTAPATPGPVPSAATATATGTPRACPPAWRIAAGPNPSWRNNVLRALAVVSADDVWAVGSAARRPLTAHWNGSGWSVVPVSNFGLMGVSLSGAAAVGPNDVWAVGSGYMENGGEQTLVLHWDGSAWSRVPSPNPGTYSNAFSSVTAVARDDIWAIGYAVSLDGSTDFMLIVHWNGRQWSRVPGPATESGSLLAVAAVATNDIWAVGATGSGTLTLHWDGATWSRVPSPRTGEGLNILSSVAVVAANDVWAVGTIADSLNYISRPLAEHWDGTRWSIIPTVYFPAPTSGALNGVTAAANDIWAVGSVLGDPLTLHWDGAKWRRVFSPSTDGSSNTLSAVAAVRAGEVWAVGSYNTGDDRDRTLVLQYSTTCSEPAPPPEGCALPFRDVDPAHPFHNNILCLYCQGFLDGYSDGTFRPDNPVTRGQAAKLVANIVSYFWYIPPGQQTFADVPPSHPFWRYIEQAYTRGVISGYSDGTFRPGASVTRGQQVYQQRVLPRLWPVAVGREWARADDTGAIA